MLSKCKLTKVSVMVHLSVNFSLPAVSYAVSIQISQKANTRQRALFSIRKSSPWDLIRLVLHNSLRMPLFMVVLCSLGWFCWAQSPAACVDRSDELDVADHGKLVLTAPLKSHMPRGKMKARILRMCVCVQHSGSGREERLSGWMCWYHIHL